MFILFAKPSKLNVEEMCFDFRHSSKVRIMVIIDLVRFVNLCIGSLYKFSNWYWGEHNHYFYSYMCLCLINFFFFFAHCSFLFLCKTAVFSFSKWSLYMMMKHVVSPLLMGICVWNEFLLLAKPPWMLRSLLNVFIFYFRNNTKMVI